jgi:hypothetical protein
MTPEPSWEEDFNDWYDREHIPLRMGVPGFTSARRYRVAGTRHYLAVYEMESVDVLSTPAYQALRQTASDRTRRMLASVAGFTRYVAAPLGEHTNPAAPGDPLDSAHVYSVFFDVPADREADFNDWYARDHIPTLLENPQWLAVRRFRIASGEPAAWTHLALHHLADRRALDSPERARARASPVRARLAQESWFKGAYEVFDTHGPRQRATWTQRSDTPSWT